MSERRGQKGPRVTRMAGSSSTKGPTIKRRRTCGNYGPSSGSVGRASGYTKTTRRAIHGPTAGARTSGWP